jgi:sugar O-acyltransferase (sialic acid O-acetyltransferase NeuD family)
LTRPKIIIIGAGGHAHSCIDVVEQDAQYAIAGLIGVPEELCGEHLGYNVIGNDSDLPELVSSYRYAMIGLGQIKTPDPRIHVFEQLGQLGFVLPSIVSPGAYVSRHATVGEGCIIMNGAIVNAGAEIGNNCIVNSRALVEHDARVSDHCHIATGVVINGNASIGVGCFIGSGSIIKQGLTVGQNSVIGMGQNVRNNLAAQSYFTGHEKA